MEKLNRVDRLENVFILFLRKEKKIQGRQQKIGMVGWQ